MSKLHNPLYKGFFGGLKVDPRWSVSQWADNRRILTSDSSNEAGKFRTSRTPYVKEIADSCSPSSPVKQVKVIKGTQIGLSTTGDNVALTYLDLYPCPILYILPTETLAKGTSKRRFTPSIRAIPKLRKKIVGGKSKDDIGETYTKMVAGGGLSFGWSNSTASFRSFSAKVVILDDVDGFGDFGEGSLMALAKARADAFSNRKIYINSTPTIKGISTIEKEFKESDQREYFMPCPDCGELIFFSWDNFVYDIDDKGKLKGNVEYSCVNCGVLIPEYKKTEMMKEENGAKWIPQNEHIHRGYRVPSFLAPMGWLSWNEIATEYLTAQKELVENGDASLMQVWVNTRQAFPYKRELKGVNLVYSNDRVEDYGADIPNEVQILIAGTDTQNDRFETIILGFGKDKNIYVIDYEITMGDPIFKSTQDRLDLVYDKLYTRVDGSTMKIYAKGIDTGGHRTKEIYEYLENRLPERIFGLKGSSQPNAPICNKTEENINIGDLVSVGTSTVKDSIFASLKLTKKGTNYIHFPKKDVIDDKFFRMLTAEKIDEKGRYVKIRKRNEALDCMVYAIATMSVVNIDIENIVYPYIHIGETSYNNNNNNTSVNSINDYLDEH